MTEQDGLDEAGWLAAWREFWRKAERLTLLTGFAFFGSTVVNTLIFDVWGQTFLAIATPSDVLMSGLHLAILPAMMGAGYALCYAWVISRKTWGRALATYLTTLILLCLVVSRGVGYGPSVLRLWYLVGLLGWLAGGMVAISDRRDARPSDDGHFGLLSKLAALGRESSRRLVQAGLILTYLVFSGAMVWVISEAGYFSYQQRLAEKQTPQGCAGRVVWTGENAVLIDCGQFPVHDVQVLYGVEGLRIVRDRRKWPEPAPPPMVVDAVQWLQVQRAARRAAVPGGG